MTNVTIYTENAGHFNCVVHLRSQFGIKAWKNSIENAVYANVTSELQFLYSLVVFSIRHVIVNISRLAASGVRSIIYIWSMTVHETQFSATKDKKILVLVIQILY